MNGLKIFKRGYQISSGDILENLDALLIEDAKDWCSIDKSSWITLSDFFKEFTNTYIDENFSDEMKQIIKFCNQKRTQDIHSYLTEIRKLFTKLYPRKSREWELRRVYENLRIEYKMYIKLNDLETFGELEDLGKGWETELAKSKIMGQALQITEPRIENKNDQKHNMGNNNSDSNTEKNNKSRKEYIDSNYQYGSRKQSNQNGRQQNISRTSWVQQKYKIPQYQTPFLQKPKLYSQGTHIYMLARNCRKKC